MQIDIYFCFLVILKSTSLKKISNDANKWAVVTKGVFSPPKVVFKRHSSSCTIVGSAWSACEGLPGYDSLVSPVLPGVKHIQLICSHSTLANPRNEAMKQPCHLCEAHWKQSAWQWLQKTSSGFTHSFPGAGQASGECSLPISPRVPEKR